MLGLAPRVTGQTACHTRLGTVRTTPRLRAAVAAMASRQAASSTHTELVAAPFSVVWRLLEEKARPDDP